MRPVLFKIGSFEMHSFGAAIIVALFVSLFIASRRAPRYGLTRENVFDLAWWALISGILGARIVFIAQEWKFYAQNLNQLFSPKFEGLTSFGGVGFGALGVWFIARRRRLSLSAVFDTLGAPFLVAHAIGRIGCLLNGCCYGVACSLPWAIDVNGKSHHPAQVYDALMNLAAFGLLLLLEKRGLRPGQSFGLMLILHGLTRFVYEFWRAGTVAEVERGLASSTRIGNLPITEAQVVAGLIMAVGALIFARARREIGSGAAAAL